MVSFDFSGSGMSEGDWVTLGYFEQHDVADVLAYLRSNGEHGEKKKPVVKSLSVVLLSQLMIARGPLSLSEHMRATTLSRLFWCCCCQCLSGVHTGMASRYLLWGRSMGAASALLYAARYPNSDLCGLILDSPFCSFRRLARDLVTEGQVWRWYNDRSSSSSSSERQGFLSFSLLLISRLVFVVLCQWEAKLPNGGFAGAPPPPDPCA